MTYQKARIIGMPSTEKHFNGQEIWVVAEPPHLCALGCLGFRTHLQDREDFHRCPTFPRITRTHVNVKYIELLSDFTTEPPAITFDDFEKSLLGAPQ